MKIIYKNEDNSIGIITPTNEAVSVLHNAGLNPWYAIAEKDVPHNLPYWIVEDTDIPSDRTFREAWTVDDLSEPDGFGGESNEFAEEQLLALYNQGIIK
jgi:hypothetical protein